MDTIDAIMARRSVHNFTDEKVDMETVGILLEAVRWAPSARNRQPWEVVVLDDREKIVELADICLEQEWVEDAPLVMVVCINHKLAKDKFGERGLKFAQESTAAAVQNLMLAATERGLGTCWIDVHNQAAAGGLLDCPDHIVPTIAVAVGYPDKVPDPPHRHNLQKFSWYNNYGEKLEGEWKGLTEHMQDFKERLIESLEKY